MDQDGKLEQRTHAELSNNASATSAGGRVLLTLCTLPEDESPYRHATICFPSSYQEACTVALKAFAAYIPPDVEAVSLRQVMRRINAQCVWSIIPEDDWHVCLERHGEEIGVFLPDMIPETIPYRKVQLPRKLAYFQFHTPRDLMLAPRVVNSLKDCEAFLAELCTTYDWTHRALYYDERMMGAEVDQKRYKDRIDTFDHSPKWRLLDNAGTFNLLLDLFPEPMWIKVGWDV